MPQCQADNTNIIIAFKSPSPTAGRIPDNVPCYVQGDLSSQNYNCIIQQR